MRLGTTVAVPVVTNTDATLKYLSPSYSPRHLLVLDALGDDSLRAFSRRVGRLDVVVLDRPEPGFRRSASDADRFLERAARACVVTPRLDTIMPDASRLRIMGLADCR